MLKHFIKQKLMPLHEYCIRAIIEAQQINHFSQEIRDHSNLHTDIERRLSKLEQAALYNYKWKA